VGTHEWLSPRHSPLARGLHPGPSPRRGRRRVTNKGVKDILQNKSAQSSEPQMQEPGPKTGNTVLWSCAKGISPGTRGIASVVQLARGS